MNPRLYLFTLLLYWSCTPSNTYDIIIRQAQILDGSGQPAFVADVALKGDRIQAIEASINASTIQEIQANGLYLAPGFIDVHSHAARGLASPARSAAEPMLVQGVTTVFLNPDGRGPIDLIQQEQDLLRDSLGVNVALLIGHASVREAVLGMDDRLPNTSELDSMKLLVQEAMEAGAFGLSSGPFYAPGSYSNTQELIELSKVVSQYDGVYTSHIRDESNYTIGLIAAVDEVIQIAREADLTAIVTHIKALGPPVWGYSERIVTNIERARSQGLRVYADQYPYNASATGLKAALLPRWAQAGGDSALVIRLNHPDTLSLVRNAMAKNLARRGGAERLQFRFFKPDTTIQGKTLAYIAKQQQLDPLDAAIALFKLGSHGIVSFNMNDEDIHRFMQQEWTMTCSDGSFPVWNVGVPHPRAFGSFSRKLRKYVSEDHVIDLPFAIRSMTGLSAEVLGVKDRGKIEVGSYADLVLFDLNEVQDKGTYTQPYQLSEGMKYVLVNGKVVLAKGRVTGVLAGEVLKK